MPRQNRRRAPATLRTPLGGGERRETWRGVEYAVRSVTGQAAVKPYRCPGCAQSVGPGTPHVVVWPADDVHAEDRRHWHTPCWAARERRGTV